MALNIKTAADPVEIGSLITLIYGQPGIGKTSLAFSADKPLLLDFDAGAHRSGFRKDYVPVKTWSEVSSITSDDLADYNTVIIDTLGACLDCLTASIIRDNAKMVNRATGGLSLPGFGALKAQFVGWVKMLKQSGCDVVMIAHGKEKNENDRTYVRPDITGGSYDEIMKLADLVGYYYMEQEQGKASRVLDFNPTPQWIGKNSAGFEPLVVPSLTKEPDFLAAKLTEARKHLTALSEEQAAAVELINDWRVKISEAETAADINAAIADVNSLKTSPSVVMQIKHLIGAQAKKLKLVFEEQSKTFLEPEKEELPA